MMDRYKALTVEETCEYVKRIIPDFFPEDAALVSKEIGDGNLNLVFKVLDENTKKSVIIKQALPHLRIVGEGWPLTIDRARIEAEALKVQNELCPGMVPKVYFYDSDLALMVLEDLSYLKLMRHELMKMVRFDKFPAQIGEFLAKTLFYTSDIAMDPGEKKAAVKKFINPELCKITEDLIFTDPYYDSETNKINPSLADVVRDFWRKKDLRLEVTKLKEIFMTKAQSLIHGDLHTGSIFISQDEIRVFDTEFAYYGPAGFDIGAVIGNLILNYASWEGKDEIPETDRSEYREYLLNMIEELYSEFETRFSVLWDRDARPEYLNVSGYKEHYMSTLLKESIGFAGCKTIRRIFGLAHVADIDSIADPGKRAAAQCAALKYGEHMIMRRNDMTCIKDLTTMIREISR